MVGIIVLTVLGTSVLWILCTRNVDAELSRERLAELERQWAREDLLAAQPRNMKDPHPFAVESVTVRRLRGRGIPAEDPLRAQLGL